MQKGFIPIVIGFVVLFLVVGSGAYYLLQRPIKPTNQVSLSVHSPTPDLETQPTQSTYYIYDPDQITFSFLTTTNNIYIQSTINSSNTKVFTPQVGQNYDPVEVKEVDIPSGSWVELVKETIDGPNSAGMIAYSNGLFSFKRVPNSNNFLFVTDFIRNTGDTKVEPNLPIRYERTLYVYDASSAGKKLKKVQTFDRENFNYSYPKIDTFSADGRYVSIKLFGCWGCGGHEPETYLLDSQTLKSKNIGRVAYFRWRGNGNYDYKDYIVIECAEPGYGACNQDPNTLPLKTGAI